MYSYECKFEGCGRRTKAKGLCSGHLNQGYAGKELTELKKHTRLAPPAPGMKICTLCLTVKSVEDFYMRTNGKTRQAVCKPCMIEANGLNQAARKARRDAERDGN